MGTKNLVILLSMASFWACGTDAIRNKVPTDVSAKGPDPVPQEVSRQPRQWQFAIDLNNDKLVDSIYLSSSPSDTSLSDRISIQIAGAPLRTFTAQDGWATVDTAFLKTNHNSILTDRLFVQNDKKGSIILLFGVLDGAGYREDFSILTVRSEIVLRVFDLDPDTIDVERPLRLADLDQDGRMDFLFTNLYETYKPVDSLDADVGSYSPYLIYTIDSTCWLNLALTKKYNEAHYVWAGPEYSEEIDVLYPRDARKKPRLGDQQR